MFERLAVVLEEKCRLDSTKPLLVGVSGGPDSLCLTDILYHLGYAQIIACFDHGLRPSSSAEVNVVREIAQARQIPFVSQRADVAVFALENHQSIEEAARNLRYRFLFAQAEQFNAQAVAVGHNADDQVETLLMNLIRGSGTSGLGGMQYRTILRSWSDSIPIVRPLLATWRTEILQYLSANHLSPVNDESNLDSRYARNRIRLDIIPMLEEAYPGMRRRIWQTAEILSADDRTLDQVTACAWADCAGKFENQVASFSRDKFMAQPRGIMRRLVIYAITELKPGIRDLKFPTVERAINFIHSPARSLQSDLAFNLKIILKHGRVFLVEKSQELPSGNFPQLKPGQVIPVEAASAIELSNFWKLEIRDCVATPQLLKEAEGNSDPWQAWLDAGLLVKPIQLRTRQPGDRIRPLGLGGHSQKIADAMINLLLPKALRDCYPLLSAGTTIAWLPGFKISNDYALSPSSRSVLHFKFTQAHSEFEPDRS